MILWKIVTVFIYFFLRYGEYLIISLFMCLFEGTWLDASFFLTKNVYILQIAKISFSSVVDNSDFLKKIFC